LCTGEKLKTGPNSATLPYLLFLFFDLCLDLFLHLELYASQVCKALYLFNFFISDGLFLFYLGIPISLVLYTLIFNPASFASCCNLILEKEDKTGHSILAWKLWEGDVLKTSQLELRK
jgi:hypothetical protein